MNLLARTTPSGTAGVFTAAEALACGWTPKAMRCAVESGRWIRLKPGVFTAVPATVDVALVAPAVAAARRRSDAVVSHGAAAGLLSLPLIASAPRACLTVPDRTPLRVSSRVHLHRAGLPPEHVRSVFGLRVTTPARTVVDLARHYGTDCGVVAADAALHGRLVDRSALDSVLQACAIWPGRAAAARALELCDGAAESPLESLSRLRIAAAGLPRPSLQVEIGDEWGRFVARTDFYWPQFGVVGEADGNAKYGTRADLIAERRRERALRDLGLEVERWEWRDLSDFGPVAARLRRAFASGVPVGERRWSVLTASGRRSG